MKILLANPRGFCAGVDRAVDIVDYALHAYGPPVYVKHEIVHNRYVVEDFERRGVRFVEDVGEIPEGAVTIFSAHGISPVIRERARARHLKVVDATCPLVTKVHLEAVKFAREGYAIILIGHAGHPEVEGTMGEVPGQIHLVQSVEEAEQLEVTDPDRVAYLTQTTLSVDDTAEIIGVLRRRFPKIVGPRKEDICYATQNRQNAVKELAHRSDLVLVVGARNSSNSNRLVEVAQKHGTPAYLVEDEPSINPGWLEGVETVGLTAGASAPEILVDRVVKYLGEHGATEVEVVQVVDERVHFPLPKELVADAEAVSGTLEGLRQRWHPENAVS